MFEERFSQTFIIDICPTPANPKKDSANDVYGQWSLTVRNNPELQERQHAVEDEAIYYIYNYDFNRIVQKLELLGTRHEPEGTRKNKKH